MSSNLTPIQVCERLLGGPAALGSIAGLNDKAAFHWRHPTKWRDAGDLPSARIMRSLLAHAAARGIPLTADMLIWGADAAEIDALLASRQAAE